MNSAIEQMLKSYQVENIYDKGDRSVRPVPCGLF